jgi:hypothetical protein
MACVIEYQGKEYKHEEFAAMLHDGLVPELSTFNQQQDEQKTRERLPLQEGLGTNSEEGGTEQEVSGRDNGLSGEESPRSETNGEVVSNGTEKVKQSHPEAEVSKNKRGKKVVKSTPTTYNETTDIKEGDDVSFDWLGDAKQGKVISVESDKIKIQSGKTKYTVLKSSAVKGKVDSVDEITKYNAGRKNPIGIVGNGLKGPGAFLFDTDLGDKISRFFTKQFTSRGFLPQTVFNRWNQTKAEISKYETQIKFTISDLKRAIGEEYGKITDGQVTDLNSALAGKTPLNPIPPKTDALIRDMRDQIDNLTKRFINEGVVAGDLTAKFTENLGTYLTRSYRKYDDPFWAEFVPEEVKNKAMAFLRDKYEGYSDQEIQGLINFLLYSPEAPMAVMKGSKLGSKDLSILKKRGDIAPEIRALMGEYGDPLLNYARSVTKMASLISKHHFLQDIRKAGMNNFLFDKPVGKYAVPIAAEGSKTMAPLNGLYTTKDIAEAFNEFNSIEPNPAWLQYTLRFFGYIKAGKTVFSVMTHARNFLGNLGFVVMNGHYRADKFGKSLQTAWANVYSKDSSIREKFMEYTRLGIVQDSAAGGELRAILNDVRDGKDFFQQISESRLKKATNGILDTSKNLYQFEDDLYKIFAFENELARYKKAYPEWSEDQVKEKAAEIVRMTYPTYSLVPKIVKALRVNPFVGSFVSFPAEVIRTTYNTIGLAKAELQNEATRSIGAQRMAGIMASLLVPTAASIASRAFLGLGDDDDKSLRRFLAPWQKDNEFIYLNHEKDKVTIWDIGASDPHSYLKKPFYALLNADNVPEAAFNSAVEVLQPFLSEEMVLTAYEDVMRNQKKNGDQVYNKYSSAGDQAYDIFHHVEGITQIGTVKSLENLTKAIKGQTDRYGKKYEVGKELVSLFTGQRAEVKDVNQALLFQAYALKDAVDQAEKEFNRIKRSKASTDKEIVEALRKRDETLENIAEEALQLYRSAVKLGVDPREAKAKIHKVKNPIVFRKVFGQD